MIPSEVLIPQDIDQEAVEALVDTKVIKPQRGEKKQLINLATKNARVSLEQKFNLLEKNLEDLRCGGEYRSAFGDSDACAD